jgi:hypothetical protein
MHRREWVCEEHDTTFPTQDLLINHVEVSHWSVQTQKQIMVLAEISERSMNNDTIVECPFCPDERRLMILHTHIAEHLESVSLFVLSATFEDEEEGDNDSQGVADGDISSRLASSSTSQTTTDTEDDLRLTRVNARTGYESNHHGTLGHGSVTSSRSDISDEVRLCMNTSSLAKGLSLTDCLDATYRNHI